MLVSIDNNIIYIDDIYVSYSSLLVTISTTQVPLDTNKDGIVILDIDLYAFNQYIAFLQGKDFYMDDDVAYIFHMMGHVNHMEYPLDIWKVKLHDDWVRDNFYRLKLYNDPLYDLVEIPIVRHLPDDVIIPKGWYVAGGAALWMAGIIDKLNDIDLFTSLGNDALESVGEFINDTISYDIVESFYRDDMDRIHRRHTGYKYRRTICPGLISYRLDGHHTTPNRYKHQLILRKYRSPSETLHGFDIDCVGIAYMPKGMYDNDTPIIVCSKRALFSIENRLIWMDPSRASRSYPYRLIKYRSRGFHLYIPQVTIDDVDDDIVQSFFNEIDKIYEENTCNIDMTRTYAEKIRYIGYKDRMIPSSRLLLAAFYDYYPTLEDIPSDYEDNDQEGPYCDDIDLSIAIWKEQDPMEQISSTNYPIPIDDIRSWFSISRYWKHSYDEEYTYKYMSDRYMEYLL